MSLANPQQLLQIRSHYRGQAFRVIEDILRTDPNLVEIKTWRSREGNDTDMQMPSLDEMPMVALSPIPQPNTILAVDGTKINFAISVQLFVQGSCVNDILAIWEAIEDAILIDKEYQGVPLRDFLCTALKIPDGTTRTIANLRPLVPAFFPVKLDRPDRNNAPEYQAGEGMLVCMINRPR